MFTILSTGSSCGLKTLIFFFFNMRNGALTFYKLNDNHVDMMKGLLQQVHVCAMSNHQFVSVDHDPSLLVIPSNSGRLFSQVLKLK